MASSLTTRWTELRSEGRVTRVQCGLQYFVSVKEMSCGSRVMCLVQVADWQAQALLMENRPFLWA